MKPAWRGQRGFALLIVLFSLGLLALIGTHITLAGRTEAQIARNLREAAAAEAAADGAIHEAVFRLRDGSPRRWVTDGLPRELAQPGVAITVWPGTPSGLLNPNSAPPALVAALLRQLGARPEAAAAIAAAMFDWRTPGPAAAKAAPYIAAGSRYAPTGKPFADIDELAAVLGMTPELLSALRPYVSVHNYGPIDPLRAPPALARALAEAGVGQPALADNGPVALLRAEAVLPSGTSFVRRATVLLLPGPHGEPFRILAWDSGDG